MILGLPVDIKQGTTLTATFIVQDNDNVKASTTTVSCVTNSKSCEITSPVLTANTSNTKVIGWNTNKNATTSTMGSGGKAIIDGNVTYYSISSTLVNITYNVGEDIPGVNTKASSLSFYSNEHTKCTSYNGNGCSIKWIPTIISPGHVVHGFSQTTSGDVINVAKTKFTKDTTLYARIYDCVDGSSKISSINVSQYEVIGNVLVEVESGIDSTTAARFMTVIRNLYSDFPHLLLWNGTVTLYTYNTYINMFGSDSGGITNHGTGYAKDFSHVSLIRYTSDYIDANTFHLRTAVHEITHAYNYGIYWNGGLDTAVSKTSNIVDLYNKYKNASNRPLSSYSYNNSSEFLSDLMEEYYRQHRQVQFNDNIYNSDSSGWTADLTAAAEKINSYGFSYYRSIGRI